MTARYLIIFGLKTRVFFRFRPQLSWPKAVFRFSFVAISNAVPEFFAFSKFWDRLLKREQIVQIKPNLLLFGACFYFYGDAAMA